MINNQAWGKNLGVDWWIYHSNRRQPVDFECLMCGIICQESMVTSLKDILLEICHCQTLRTEKFSRRSLSEDALMMSVEFMIHDLSLFWSKFLDVNSSYSCSVYIYTCIQLFSNEKSHLSLLFSLASLLHSMLCNVKNDSDTFSRLVTTPPAKWPLYSLVLASSRYVAPF